MTEKRIKKCDRGCMNGLRKEINHSQIWTPHDLYLQTGGVAGSKEATEEDKVPKFRDIPYYVCNGCGMRYTAEEAELE